MSKIQLHAYALVILLALTVLGTRAAKPLALQGQARTDFSLIPLELEAWTGRESQFDEETYRLLPSCSLLLRYYEHEDLYAPVELAVIYGTDLGEFHQPEICLEGQGLRSVEKGRVRIREDDGTSFEAVSLIMDSDYGRRAFIFWFASEGTTSIFLGNYKMKIFVNRLFAREIKPSALVRLSTQVFYSDEEAVERLVRFAESVVPYLKEEFSAGSP